MAKRKKSKATIDDRLKLLELQCAIMQHCNALKAVQGMLSAEKYQAAIGRLDSAVTALLHIVRGQSIGMTFTCPNCGNEQAILEWADDRICHGCGQMFELPEMPEDQS